MSAAYWLQGDTRTVLAEMAAAGIVVDLVVTSPPFLGLRSYLPAGDPNKALEIGGEATPGEFIDGLLDVTEACDLVLAPHGSLCIELGDTRAGSGGAGGDYDTGGMRDGQNRFNGSAARARAHVVRERTRTPPVGWPAEKSHSLTPELFRLALAYGFNPLEPVPLLPPHRHPAWPMPRTSRTRWRVRNVVRWVRPNPPVGADGDKFRPATSDVVIACRTDEAGRRRYWDGDAVRTEPREHSKRYGSAEARARHGNDGYLVANRGDGGRVTGDPNPAGAPLLDWWKITAAGYEGAHYATWPPKLVEPLIKAMCPERVCTVCGEPSRRIATTTLVSTYGGGTGDRINRAYTDGKDGAMAGHGDRTRHTETLGWTDCGCSANGSHWRPGIVLDPFAGSGTTLSVATGHGRDAIGIDLDSRNTDLARDRVGPLFFHETTVHELAALLRAALATPEVA